MFSRDTNFPAGQNQSTARKQSTAVGFINVYIKDTSGSSRKVGYMALEGDNQVQAQIHARLAAFKTDEERDAEVKRLFAEVFEINYNPHDPNREVELQF